MFQGSMTVGDLVLMNILMLQLYIPLNFLGTLYREIKQGVLDVEKMQVILNTPREVVDCVGAKPVHFEKSPSIEFKQACFAYDPARPILSNLSFKIEAGTTTAVVGSSGAGKSTLLRLLFRFYDVTGGAVLIDGIDVREMTQESLRKYLGVVPQDTVLFNDTIYYNIAYGNPDASEEAVIDAARRAHIHDLVARLPLGYDTRVGERGLKLSGGEKQRVAIARTLLKNPSILIFDEATSALDSHSERAIQTELDMLRESKTSLVIAHRLSTVVNADQILVMQAGRVVEAGTHQELLAKDGLYASMWQLQQSEAAEPADVDEMDVMSLSDR
jgi:ATP-binding cassette subfamily B protein